MSKPLFPPKSSKPAPKPNVKKAAPAPFPPPKKGKK